MKNRVEFVLDSLSGRILDVGFSACTLHQRLLERFPAQQVFGVDIESVPDSPQYKQGSAESIPFGDGEFDSLLAGELIEHLHEPERFVGEARRVLRKGGKMVLTTPNRQSLVNRLAHSYEAPLHFSLFSIPELSGLVQKNGFEIKAIFCLPYTPESSPGARHAWFYPVRKAVHFVLPKSLQEEIVLLAVKK